MENVSSSCLALVALCCADKRLLLFFFLTHCGVNVLCVCSQRCRFTCDGLHDISCLGQVKKSSALSLAFVTHFLNLVAERWVPGSVNSYSLDRSYSLHSA